MTDVDSRENSADRSLRPIMDEFQLDLRKARRLLNNQDVEAALSLLVSLKQEFLRGAEVLDLLGEVLVQKGRVQEGVRYKTLYEIVRVASSAMPQPSGLLQQLPDEEPLPDLSGEAFRAGEGLAGDRIPPDATGETRPAEADEEALTEFVPVTPAMGHEFMRQGHFDRALRIFCKLLEQNPADESLKAAKERAEKKQREKQLLAIFSRWLKNIDSMKAGRFSRI